MESCGEDRSCAASVSYYQGQSGGSSSSSSGTSSSSSSSSGGNDYAGSSSGGSDGSDNDDGNFGRTGVSSGGSTNQIQNARAAFNPMPYVIGGFLLVGVLASIVLRKRVSLKNQYFSSSPLR